eukprot:SAG31_NODE_9108_length_1331_cov_1.359806_2_plen_214_part_00
MGPRRLLGHPTLMSLRTAAAAAVALFSACLSAMQNCGEIQTLQQRNCLCAGNPLFLAIDTNYDNEITATELSANLVAHECGTMIWQTVCGSAARPGDSVRVASPDGSLVEVTVPAGITCEAENVTGQAFEVTYRSDARAAACGTAFARIDSDGSGSISYAEFSSHAGYYLEVLTSQAPWPTSMPGQVNYTDNYHICQTCALGWFGDDCNNSTE